MKVFLFLYPITEFFTHSIGYPDYDEKLADQVVSYFGEAIEARYRQQGFQVCWLVFRSQSGGFDLENIDLRVGIAESDQLVDPGMTFVEHCPCLLRDVPESRWPKPVYADLPSVYAQLPSPLTELWLGGFQHSDCVNKAARFAYHRLGLKGRVHVDEDLTGQGVFNAVKHFDRALVSRLGLDPSFDPFPLVRRGWTYEDLGFTRHQNWRSDWLWQRVRRIRNLQPWYVHN